MKSILLYVQNDDGMEARMQCALDLARANGGHIKCILPEPIAMEVYGSAFIMTDIVSKIEKDADELKLRIVNDLANEGVTWTFERSVGERARVLIGASYLSDIVVMSCPSAGKRSSVEIGIIGDVVMQGQTLVMVAPETQQSFDPTGTAIIAWNGSFEAAHALRNAVPLLKKASEVIIVAAEHPKKVDYANFFPSTDASEYLSRHGISSEFITEVAKGRDIDKVLSAIASVRNADYIVMGAYGHNRAREFMFGGVTRAMLKTMPLPLFLSH